MTANATTTPSSASMPPAAPGVATGGFMARIVAAAAVAHFLNDIIQAILPAIYPMLKAQYALSFRQVGEIALVYQITASLLQPWVGLYTDKRPMPYLLPAGMGVTLLGIGLLALSTSFPMLLVSAGVIGVGSATFHPEASRVARMASGGRFGTAQSAFQVGGNAGSAVGPLLVAAIVVPLGQTGIGWFALVAVAAVYVLLRITGWTLRHGQGHAKKLLQARGAGLQGRDLVRAMVVIAVLMFAKFVYIAAFTNYFTFYLMERFALDVRQSQLHLFVFLAAIAVGTFAGGPVGDRIGRKAVIWISFVGVAPFALALPYADLFWTSVLSVLVGLVMSSAFAALVVYAQEAAPGRVGMVSGLMFGLMFGIGGIGAAALGQLADARGIVWVYHLGSFLPLLGFATALLPGRRAATASPARQG